MAQRPSAPRKPGRARPQSAKGRKRKSKSGLPRHARRAGSAAVAPAREPKYKKGDYVVHIQHGVAHISDIQVKSDFGETQEYFVLNFPTEEMVISVPTNKTLYTMRPLINKTEASRVVQKLKEDPQESGANWSRWYKVLQEKMYSGDIFQVAEVVRDLNYSNQTKGISPGPQEDAQPGPQRPDHRGPLFSGTGRRGGRDQDRPGPSPPSSQSPARNEPGSPGLAGGLGNGRPPVG